MPTKSSEEQQLAKEHTAPIEGACARWSTVENHRTMKGVSVGRQSPCAKVARGPTQPAKDVGRGDVTCDQCWGQTLSPVGSHVLTIHGVAQLYVRPHELTTHGVDL